MQLLFVVCCFSAVTVSSGFRAAVGGHACVSDYWSNISCVLNVSGEPDGRPRLQFTNTKRKAVSCPLLPAARGYVCDCAVKTGRIPITSDDQYDIQACDESSCQTLQPAFVPRRHVQLTPPPEVQVRSSAHYLNISCSSRYSAHRYISDRLRYQLQVQGRPSRAVQVLVSPAQHTEVTAAAAARPDQFCVRARYRCVEDSVRDVWSAWSAATCWTDGAPDPDKVPAVLAKALGPLGAILAVVWFLFNIPAARMKMRTVCFTPSPAPFFQKTSVQDWPSPPGKQVLVLQTDEVLTSVSLVPKVVWKDPEETLDLLAAPLVQMTQGLTSYVGLDQMNAPACLPSPGRVGTDAVPPLDLDFLESSCEDGLSPRPESRPLPQTCCSDYCLLNKTPQGLAPVLVSSENSSESRGTRETRGTRGTRGTRETWDIRDTEEIRDYGD